MKRSIIASLLCGIIANSIAAENAVEQMAAYSVAPEFTLLLSAHWKEGDNAIKFISIDDRPELSNFGTFRSSTLRSGDQIVGINGKPVTQMFSHECRITLSKAQPGKRIDLEVRARNSHVVRKVTAFRVPRKVESNVREGRKSAGK